MTTLNLCRLAATVATVNLSFTASAAINSTAIVSSFLSPQCLEYKVVGICYWLLCDPHGCKIKTWDKVRHYVPDAVVSSYAIPEQPLDRNVATGRTESTPPGRQ